MLRFLDEQVMEENMSIQEVASSIAEKVLGASLEREGPSEAEGPLFLSRHISQTSVAQGTAAEWPSSIAIPIVFVLNSPRSGSTLFQLILNTHPRLWAPQELHIIMFSTVGEWRQWLWGTVYVEPLIGAVLELLQYDSAPTNGDARARVASWSHDAPIYDVYMHLQQGAKPTILVRSGTATTLRYAPWSLVDNPMHSACSHSAVRASIAG